MKGKNSILEKKIVSPTKEILKVKYLETRNSTVALCKYLKTEDYVAQPAMDISPPKWHLGHTTWFFEYFILMVYADRYKEYNPSFAYFFNSYYESLGNRVFRGDRGNMTRPSVEEIYQYRIVVDEAIMTLLNSIPFPSDELSKLITLGINHEQQHQELLITDIKYILGHNPLYPSLFPRIETSVNVSNHEPVEQYLEVEEGLYEIGTSDIDNFSYDNEREKHKVYLHPFQFLNRLVTNGEYIDFIEDKGYQNFTFWLSAGWEWVNQNHIDAPLYWHKLENEWHYYTLTEGLTKVDRDKPVTHVSFYEADAYAKWKNKRLLTEQEWESACLLYTPNPSDKNNFMESMAFEPKVRESENSLQLFGDCWEWTNSAYLPYPYYQKEPGALGEYNGKFMINQMVLRGGSCATPLSHIRPTYRNFFQTEKRWQYTGIRLADYIF
ncbi:MAG: ergothioneine biosynthesis protein EgtB [Sporocytophaga sp.]|uniref:ergothioneine biosynthesis protein EgtB n=1 Tax=Sporocytophaga sp. TaxID=2231183 RepID=UPI001AFF6447|nr:ergothioneine biosynthesis protein EgtB [Sporocytophaga sp.]MBO9703781.1 ergothioneine biosynthesis protein EgtB [Sporocytophaga sp.]